MANDCTNCDDSAAKFKIVEKPVGVPVGRWITPMVRRNGQVGEMFPGEKINPCWLPDFAGGGTPGRYYVFVTTIQGSPCGSPGIPAPSMIQYDNQTQEILAMNLYGCEGNYVHLMAGSTTLATIPYSTAGGWQAVFTGILPAQVDTITSITVNSTP